MFCVLDVVDPIGDVTRFIQNYNELFGNEHPVFYQGTYSQVRIQCCEPLFTIWNWSLTVKFTTIHGHERLNCPKTIIICLGTKFEHGN